MQLQFDSLDEVLDFVDRVRPRHANPASVSQGDPFQVRDNLARIIADPKSNLVPLVKIIRHATGLGLKDAKQMADGLLMLERR